ncbi:hypothetical protein BO78DRAFT_428735 [Aspergillus sclerotiicarbonarius CBS 121057]|uniref:Uncharacterized protein n=1 Tax=Aspergillus sclerotiicarbonarius (strain CBS 121057 / IBT 28362) TaxID=1448318 RepID=A0A319EYV1_ASPSB|nr:hypothetical protein BO78DRAFT_428735 [Aspergillus sclerotiicarbonarius CBS 121057]
MASPPSDGAMTTDTPSSIPPSILVQNHDHHILSAVLIILPVLRSRPELKITVPNKGTKCEPEYDIRRTRASVVFHSHALGPMDPSLLTVPLPCFRKIHLHFDRPPVGSLVEVRRRWAELMGESGACRDFLRLTPGSVIADDKMIVNLPDGTGAAEAADACVP